MQIFVRVAEAGSFSSVANHLGVDRSQITRQIAALEKYLGTKLITRNTRNLSLTNAGLLYLEKSQTILSALDELESSLATETNSIARGRIRIGMPLIYGQNILMPLLLDFAQVHPLLELEFELSDQRANLIDDGLDLSIRITSEPQPNDIMRLLAHCRLLTVASPEYLSNFTEPQHPVDLQQHQCLLYTNAGSSRTWSYNHNQINVQVQGRIVANNGSTLLNAAIKGFGIARLPDFIAADSLKNGTIKEILLDYSSDLLGVFVLLPSNRYIPQRIRNLIEFIAERIADGKN